jgi:hypothetical protein
MRRVPWKLVGLAGVAGVAATGVVVARRRAAREDIPPDELRARLHDRLAETQDRERPGAATERPLTDVRRDGADETL